MAGDIGIGTIRAAVEVDARTADASLKDVAKSFQQVGTAAQQSAQKIVDSVGQSTRAQALQASALDKARHAWEQELVQQDRAIQKDKEATRQRELSVLKADILSRSLEKQSRAQELVATTGDFMRRTLETAGIVVSIGAIAEGLKHMVESTMEAGVEIGHMAMQTGISAENLSALKYAATTTGLEFESLVKGFKKLSTETYLALTGSAQAAKAFQGLGISTDDLRAKGNDLYGILSLISDKFKEMPDGYAKNALASELFGKTGQQLIPILNQGAVALARLKAVAPIFTDADVEEMEKLHQSTVNLSTAWKHVELSIVQAIGPATESYLNNFAEGISVIAEGAKSAWQWMDRLAHAKVESHLGGLYYTVQMPPASAPGAEPPRPPRPITDDGVPPAPAGPVIDPRSLLPTPSTATSAFTPIADAIRKWAEEQKKYAADDAKAAQEIDKRLMPAWEKWLSTQQTAGLPGTLSTSQPMVALAAQHSDAVQGLISGLDETAAAFADIKAAAHDLVVNGLNQFNESIARLMTGQGGDVSQMFRGLAQQAGKSGLQLLEGSVLKGFGFGKRDGSSPTSAIYTINAGGIPGSAVPGGNIIGALNDSDFMGSLFGGKLFGAGSFFGGLKGFADGGVIPSNIPSIVGERGPELFMPSTAGRIVPNHQLTSGGDGQVVMHIDARGTDPALTRANFARALQATGMQATVSAAHAITERARRRPR